MIEQNIMEELRKFNAQSRRQHEGHGAHCHGGAHRCHRPGSGDMNGMPFMANGPRNGWYAVGPKAPVRPMPYAPNPYRAMPGRPGFGAMNGMPVGMAPMHKMPVCPGRMEAAGCGRGPVNHGPVNGPAHHAPAHHGFGHGAFRILDKLSETEGISQTQLAEALEIRPQSVSEAVRALVAKGLVKKELCGEDRRAVRIYLTEAGAIARAEVQEMREYRAQKKFGNLTEDEKAELLRLLKKLNESTEKAD